MRQQIITLPALALLLAACGSSDPAAESGEGASDAANSGPAVGSPVKPQAGLYRTTMEVLEVNMPGAPPQAAGMMKQMMGGRSHEYCLTQADVDKGFEPMVRQSQKDGDCNFKRFNSVGGKIDAQMVCNAGENRTMTMTMNGTATPVRSEMTMTMVGDMMGRGESTIRMKAIHERIGDCK